MERPSFRSLPAVRRKRRAEALLFAGFAAALAVPTILGTALQPHALPAFLLLGAASAAAVMQRETSRGRRRGLVGATLVTGRSQAPVLWDAVHACASAAGIAPPTIWLLDDVVPIQAASWGFGADRAIGMRRHLAERLPAEWVRATVAHEVAHLAMGDLAATAVLQVLRRWTRLVALLSAALAFVVVFHGPYGRATAVLALCAIVAAGMSLVSVDAMLYAGMPHLRYRREFAADAVGIALTGDPQAAMRLMIFFAVAGRDAGTDPTPKPGRTHPPPLARVQAMIAGHPQLRPRRRP